MTAPSSRRGRGAGLPPDRPAPARGRVRTGMTWGARLLVGGLVMLVAVVGVTALRVWQVARIDDQRSVDAVVVLGAAQYNGEPSAVLRARLKHAEQLYRDGVAPRIVTVGGGRSGDRYTEAEASRDWLLGQGVSAGGVQAVAEGEDTLGSLEAVAVAAREQGWESALLVSDPWHSLRARTMARDAGLEAWTSPTRSGPMVQTRQTQFQYIYRETGALLFYELTHASVDTAASGLG